MLVSTFYVLFVEIALNQFFTRPNICSNYEEEIKNEEYKFSSKYFFILLS